MPEPTPSIDDGNAVVDARIPLGLVCDQDSAIRHFLSLILQSSGVDAQDFADGPSMRRALDGKIADLVFINVDLDTSDPIETLGALASTGFTGAIQLMSSRGPLVMERVSKAGEQHKLKILPGLKKPFDAAAIQKTIKDLKIGLPPAVAARLRLDETLAANMVEFWFQPRIDLRRKRLIGAEAYPRARHPQYGVLPPSSFMPGADQSEINKVAELAITSVIEAERQFATVGVHLPITLNIDVTTLSQLAVPEIVNTARNGDLAGWPGLIVDLTEKEIGDEVPLAVELDRKFSPCKVKLAMDDVGRGQHEWSKAETSPFVEFKIDGMFVADPATDKVNAPICRAAIELARRFGGSAGANGLSRSVDITALAGMGCNVGQGPLLGQPMPQDRFLSLLRQRAAAQRPGPGQAA